MIRIPVQLKLLVPGYRAGWRHRYAGLLATLAEHVPSLEFGDDGQNPWIKVRGGPQFFGFWTEPANDEVYQLLKPYVPPQLPRSHFRLVKDYITRYLFPHMRPDLKPDGFPVEQLFGFHGQHKDAIADLAEEDARALLFRAFKPKPDDVIINCGAFLGFGDVRMAADLPKGRIYALEADRDCYELLEKNLACNRIGNVTALHRAVWKEEGEMVLETGYAQANTLVREVYQGGARARVRTIAIDQVVEQFGLKKLDMLSLTLNGAEIEALKGARHALTVLRPRIRLAGWYKRENRPIWQWTKDDLEAQGYRVFVGARGNVMALPKVPA
jgi:FkbM family methyltransferase